MTERQRSIGRLGRGLAAVALVLLSACSSKGAKPSGVGPTSTIVSTTSTTTVAQVDSLVLSQWQLARQTLTALQRNPGDATTNLLLADYVTDPLLSYSRNQFAARSRDGLVDIGTIDYGHPRVVSLTASQATVVSCVNDGLELVVKATGKPLPGTDTNPQLESTTSTMVLDPSGTWKMSNNVIKAGTCAGV